MVIEGSLEVVVNGESGAQRVRVASLESIPSILANNFGITAIEGTTPPVTVGTVDAAGTWIGTKGGKTAIARLWRDIPFEETAIGRALVSGEIDPLNPGAE